ncbi:MAG TPA: sulfatase-like hydrolase/transferase [Chitinophaga sp.]|uniref:sulfatase-like hydrolase/transferase n=1 Tax=Chitinophaga sp. TaxID=1869181 RepID=UPI002C94F113|nr:sulfatase-like hydrolase/transferase [Chitinophaga sp.]HVI43736.1 sulfatase-like hydrolase/transferase [Chitinophaga sp.]
MIRFKLTSLLVVTFMGCMKFTSAQNNGKAKPNIIFILVDDLGYGDVGVFNQHLRKAQQNPAVPYLVTPSLDRMAASGAIFLHQYCNAPVCAPSRASLMTGVTQGHARVRDNQFDKALEDNYTMAGTLKQAGYTTVAIGKWCLQGQKEWTAHPLKRGFDQYYGYIRHADGHEHYPHEGLYRGIKEMYDDTTNVTAGLEKCYTGDLWTARAKQWIVSHAAKQQQVPFFMYLSFDTPHATIELPTQEYPKGSGLHGGLQWLGTPGHMINTASGTVDSWIAPVFRNAMYKDNKTGELKPWTDVDKRYATVVQRLDQQIGDILQLLKDLKIDKNTLVVFSSDNGPSAESYLPEKYTPEFFDGYGPFDGIKRDTWEGGVRMPVIAQWVGVIAPGKKIMVPSMLSDWMPTFLDAAGMTAPARTDGVSLLPSLTGRGKQQNGQVYVEYFENGETPAYPAFDKSHAGRRRRQMQLIRMDNYVGVRYDIRGADDDFEIYNVMNDPKETRNLAAQLPDLETKMKAKVMQVRMPDPEAPRPYDQALIPAVTLNVTTPGIRWKLYNDQAPWVASTESLSPLKSGVAADLQHIDESAAGLVTCQTYIRVPEDGMYTFYLKAGQQAFLRIHEAAVIDEDYGYVPGTERSAVLPLKKGLHPLSIVYRNMKADRPLSLQWQGPGFDRREAGKTDFYRQ